MYRNRSIILLVLFAVVLLLPAFQVEGLLSLTKLDFECTKIVTSAGSILCRLYGSKGMSAYLPKTCQVRCHDANQKLDLHPNVCLWGSPNCTEDLKQNFLKWKTDMEKIKADLTSDWCRK
ncbi:uncharacterized protein LOC120848789 [Ixodes scapularis]|uniref:uncharacterized protein LOC120848789 n=1 Tax=Ixodes scapularis TaxID=6945 RepID=UPI001A9D87DF|nr:uncharacterized protein LOC120848789 [Ixodes scapularis]